TKGPVPMPLPFAWRLSKKRRSNRPHLPAQRRPNQQFPRLLAKTTVRRPGASRNADNEPNLSGANGLCCGRMTDLSVFGNRWCLLKEERAMVWQQWDMPLLPQGETDGTA